MSLSTDKSRHSYIIRLLYKCLKKYTLVFYLFHYIIVKSEPFL